VVTRWHVAFTVTDGKRPDGRTRCVQGCFGISIIRLLAGKQVDSYTECATVARPTEMRGLRETAYGVGLTGRLDPSDA
jgi:hypothetical protein